MSFPFRRFAMVPIPACDACRGHFRHAVTHFAEYLFGRLRHIPLQPLPLQPGTVLRSTVCVRPRQGTLHVGPEPLHLLPYSLELFLSLQNFLCSLPQVGLQALRNSTVRFNDPESTCFVRYIAYFARYYFEVLEGSTCWATPVTAQQVEPAN